MANGNEITIVGNITRDPELRFTSNGTAVTGFGVAYNHRKFNKNTNEWDEKVSFFDVTCWQSLGENVAKSLLKGDRVIVNGRLEQNSWETQDGDKRSKLEIVAESVGPDLRWSEATITKNERLGSTGPAPRSNAPAPATAAPEPEAFDEEPF